MSAVPDRVPATVFLRPLGVPLSLGMSGLAIASLVRSGFDLHWLAANQSVKVGLILLAVPAALQGIASVLCYLARDGASGAAMVILAASWLAIGLVQATSSVPHRNGAVGLMLLASAGTLGLSAIAVSTAKPLPGAVFALEAVRFALAGIYELGGAGGWRDVAGITGLVVVGVAAYCVLAFELEGQLRRPVLPTFRRGRGRDAVLGDPEAAVDDVFHDPGVRQTT